MRKVNCLLCPLAVFLLAPLPPLQCSLGDNADISCADQMKSIGQIVRFKPDEMKKRAIHKVDIDPTIMAHLDFSSTIVLEVVVAPDGSVVCTRTLYGFAPASAGVEKAVHQLKFRPVKADGKAATMAGVLQFRLCNINCGKDMSMSILN